MGREWPVARLGPPLVKANVNWIDKDQGSPCGRKKRAWN